MPAVTDDGEIPPNTQNKNTCRWPGFISWDVWALTLLGGAIYVRIKNDVPFYCRVSLQVQKWSSNLQIVCHPITIALGIDANSYTSRPEHAPHINHETCPFLFFLSFLFVFCAFIPTALERYTRTSVCLCLFSCFTSLRST